MTRINGHHLVRASWKRSTFVCCACGRQGWQGLLGEWRGEIVDRGECPAVEANREEDDRAEGYGLC